ncbi:RecF/RecN/SMC protein [Dipodascopsis uninucleata]
MGQLTRIEVCNFKSYKSVQRIDFGSSYFTSIIGPNGAGKSNMMDAISFVLGIKSSHLRSSQLKDLVYRGRIMKSNQGAASKAEQDPTTASVTAVYVKDDGSELHLKRSIGTQGNSEYRLNGKVVSAHEYSRALEDENILIRARNFLVFQGDVEAIAAQSPKDLTKLIEQISGSLDYKAEYDALKEEQERATDASMQAFNKKRTYNTEIKQYQEQKVEVENYERKLAEKELAIRTHILWKLFHCEAAIDNNKTELQDNQVRLRELYGERDSARETLDGLKTEHAKVLRQLQKQERGIKKLEKMIEDKSTSLVPVDEKIKVITANERRHLTRQKEVMADHARQQASVAQLQRDLEILERAISQFEQEQLTARRGPGISLSENDLKEYNQLKENFNRQAAREKSRLDNLIRQRKADEDSFNSLQSKMQEFERQRTRLQDEISANSTKSDQVSGSINQDLQDAESKRQQLSKLVNERLQQSAKEKELNEKLQKCLSELIDVNADKRESERELRLRESIASLKRLIPGVRGRVSDLCKPKQRKYETAMVTVLGRNFDAVVVDTQKTATECIAYMREQRSGICTFIPLDSVVVKPISTNLRGMHKQMRLAIDTIDFDATNERAMQYVCGSAIVCDDINVAKQLRWEQGIDAKAVTLDGSVIHKGGLMTGGRSNSSNTKKWEDNAVKGLQRLKDNLLMELAELAKNKQHPNYEQSLSSEISGIEQRLDIERDELASIKRVLQGKQTEVKFIERQLQELLPKLEQSQSKLEGLNAQSVELEERVRQIENSIFQDFCRKIKVSSIREYEEFQGAILQEASRKRLEYTTQKSRLNNQYKFEAERLNETTERIANINTNIERERQLVEQLKGEKAAIREEIDLLKAEVLSNSDEHNRYKDLVANRAEEVSKQKGEVQFISKQIDDYSRSIVSIQEELEKAVALKMNVLRNCKMESIDIPLIRGSLDDVPIGGDPIQDNLMELDEESGPSQVPGANEDYGIEVDYDSLDDDLKDNGADEVEETLLDNIKTLTSDLEKMSPNMKALERLEEVEDRLHDTEQEFDKARKGAKNAKDRFNAVKERRLELFNKAYEHIAEQIDRIYKDLTRSKAFPLGGTAYLTIEDQDEPYLDGIKYHAMPPMKRFRDMEQLSGGEKTMAALALLFSIHSYRPSPFFVLDEVDAALDNANVAKIANYIHDHAGPGFQFIVISLKNALFQRSDALVGIYRAQLENSSRALTLDLRAYPEA